ncbi:DEAD/DEAH box helicase [Catelliglobosispora koreensis]|uniref:DEAD/DEAH box helicase n=1 Tax=Catelliglobosispora koreensis TaxID=129052 RepID=UPI001FE0979F|nr:DEAD/DEAH box helicase [Catelliglobosispora koreensis]
MLETFPPLRAWQRKALFEYLRRRSTDFLAVATPGAGKTTFALRIAAELLSDRTVEAVTVVAPTEHLKLQWAQAASRVGIQLDSAFRNADIHTSKDFHGAVVTYAQVGMAPQVHLRRTLARKTLVILDEIHHAGDSRSWGEGVRLAYEQAERRLMLTGTPFRSDENPIPFVVYERSGEVMRSRADSTYGYGDALADGVVRPVIFLAYSGETRWRTSAGEELAVRLGEPLTQDLVAQAWRTALDPAGDWMPQVLKAADARLQVLRAGGIPDAGGLVIASDQTAARAYAKLLERVTGEKPTVVLSDDTGASGKIGQFANDPDKRWLVAVRMVSEGVDIPRLAVGVYATSASTPLYFAQAIGRFVRARRPGETASVFVPSVPHLLGLASEMELSRDHVLGGPKNKDGLDDELLERANKAEKGSDELTKTWEALSATAELDQVIFDGATFGLPAQSGTAEEEEFLGLPGLLSADQVTTLLAKRQADQAAQARRAKRDAPAQPQREMVRDMSAAERRIHLRRQLNALVAAHHHRTGLPHGKIHSELRTKCGGPPSAQATIEQLEERISMIQTL